MWNLPAVDEPGDQDGVDAIGDARDQGVDGVAPGQEVQTGARAAQNAVHQPGDAQGVAFFIVSFHEKELGPVSREDQQRIGGRIDADDLRRIVDRLDAQFKGLNRGLAGRIGGLDDDGVDADVLLFGSPGEQAGGVDAHRLGSGFQGVGQHLTFLVHALHGVLVELVLEGQGIGLAGDLRRVVHFGH